MTLAVRGLAYRQNGLTVLAGVDLDVATGELVVVHSSPWSSGRSLVGLLGGRRRPLSGDAVLDEVSLVDEPERWRRRAAYVAPLAPTPRRLTTRELLDATPCRTLALRVQMVELFELDAFADRPLTELDEPSRARLSLALALLTDPALLLIDRPFAWRDAADARRAREHTRAGGDAAAEVDKGRAADEGLAEEWAEMLAELARMGKTIVMNVEEPPRRERWLTGLAHRLVLIEDGVLLPPIDADRAAPRLGLESFVRITPRTAEELAVLYEMVRSTAGFRAVRRVGQELIATYGGPMEHAHQRLEAKAQAAGIEPRISSRNRRPSRLPFEV